MNMNGNPSPRLQISTAGISSLLGNLSIRNKLILLAGVLLGTVAVVGVNAFRVTSSLGDAIKQISGNDTELAKAMSMADMMHDGLRAVVYRAIIASERNDQLEKRASVEELKEFTENINNAIKTMDALQLSPTVKKALTEAKAPVDSYVRAAGEIVGSAATAVTTTPADTARLYGKIPAFQGAFDELEKTLGELADQIVKETGEAGRAAVQESDSSRRTALVLLLAGSVIGILISFVILRAIVAGISNLSTTAQSIARGDLQARAMVNSQDELGVFASAFNGMIDARIKAQEETEAEYKRLQSGIQELLMVTSDASDGNLTVRAKVSEGALGNVSDAINLMLENVGDILKEVQAASTRVASAATEIQAAAEQLSQGSEKQYTEVVNTTAAVQEMASNIESVANNATGAAESSERSRAAAEQGAKAVVEVIAGMDRIRQNVQAGAKKIKRLGERSMEISTIVSTISQISSLTDMLALNAAIEAARAGEHGRGFTVVADEVRKLSERTAAATKEIEKLIAGIQAETNESVTAMEQQTTEVDQESRVVAGAGDELTRIKQSAVQSSELVNEINLAAKQQVRGAAGVVKAMELVSNIAQQAQSGTAQTKRATETLTALATELNRSLAKFRIAGNGA